MLENRSNSVENTRCSGQLKESQRIDRMLCSKYPLKILVAEDNLINRKLVISILKRMGYNVSYVTNGQEAVDMVRQMDFDIVLMDIQMPVMSGVEATIKIKSEVPHNRQPLIIALTANSEVEDKETCLKSGMVDYMSKPINLSVLQNVLSKWGNYLSTGNLQ